MQSRKELVNCNPAPALQPQKWVGNQPQRMPTTVLYLLQCDLTPPALLAVVGGNPPQRMQTTVLYLFQ